jgi:hypothetical protein
VASKFNFYDFLGYIIPGSFLTLVFAYLLFSSLGETDVLVKNLSGFGETIIFLVIGYFVGHLIQVRGAWIEREEKKRWGGWFSIQFLRKDNNHYTEDFKRRLKESAEKQFGIVEIKGGRKEIRDRRYQEIFQLCYTSVVQKGASGQADIFNAICLMLRGILAVCEVVAIIAGLAVVFDIYQLINYWRESAMTYFMGELPSLAIAAAILAIALFLRLRPVLRDRLKHFAELFVDSIYRNFVVDTTAPKKK